jgi:hypothetical protein
MAGQPQYLVGAQPPLLLGLGNPPLRFAVGRVAARVEDLAPRRARQAPRDSGRPEQQSKRAGDLALVGGLPRRASRKQIWKGNTRPGAAAFSRMGSGCTQALYSNYRVQPSGTLEIPVVKRSVAVQNGE